MGDVESLFGSPPASPSIRAIHLPSATGSYCSLPGRSTSPTTQSPHYGPISALRTTQNVGNIALPGSPNISETTPSIAHLNLLQFSSQSQHQSRLPTPLEPNTASQPQPQQARKQQKQPARKSRSASSSPATGPAVELPWTPYDASNGPPKNYLRNQPALLGNAGVVGQVTQPFTPTGTRATNPIIVEAEPVPPITLPPLPPPKKKFQQPKQPNPNVTSAPSTTPDILATLRSNPKLVPLLKTLLNHIGSTSALPRSGTPKARGATSPEQPRPSKRRKLDRVPGGAENWDVPFPFKPGEGPPGYTEKWKSERGRKLLADLVNMLRVAVDKTAPPPAPSPSPSSSRRPSVAASSTYTGSSLSTPSTSTAPLPDVGFDVNDFLSLLNSVPTAASTPSQPLGAFDFLSLFEAQDASGTSSLLSWEQPLELDGDVCGSANGVDNSGAIPMQIDDQTLAPSSLAAAGSAELNWLEGFTFPPPIPILQQPARHTSSLPQPDSNIIIDPSLLGPPQPVTPSVTIPSPSPVTFEFAPPSPAPLVSNTTVGIDVNAQTISPSGSAPSPGPSVMTPAIISSTGMIMRMPKTRKLEVLAAAKLKREAILEELNLAKMQRWECTIERAVLQGVLRRG